MGDDAGKVCQGCGHLWEAHYHADWFDECEGDDGTCECKRFSYEEKPRTCIYVDCTREATHFASCQMHWEWAYVTLADKRYRTERPPSPSGAQWQLL